MEERLAQLHAKIEADHSLVEKLVALETSEEVQSLLKEQGLEFSFEEINMLRDVLVKTIEKGNNGELSDEDLEDVAGGIAITLATVGILFGIAGSVATIGFGAGNFVNNVTKGKW